MTIQKFSNRSQTGWLVRILVLLPFLLGTLNDLLGLPYGIRYLLDVVWVLLTVYLLRFRASVDWRHTAPVAALVLMYLACAGLVYLVQYQSALYFLWGFRNNFRFYAAFFAFAAFLRREDVAEYDALFDKLFWGNAAVSLVQYLIFGLKGDHLGGIFGTTSGVNGYTNIFFLIVLTGSLVRYLEKKETGVLCAAKCLTAVVIAAMGELKFFYVELPVIVALAVLVTRFTWRKLWVILGGTAVVFAGAALLVLCFPQYAGWFSLEWMLDVVTSSRGYTSSGDLNRLTAIPRINDLWLTHWPQRFFGKGLGNCDTSSFAVLSTPFYLANGRMHYTWIGYAFQYLENGWVGLGFYFSFFALVYFRAYRLEKRSPEEDRTHCRVARILAVCCLMLSVYNASLRMESGYMIYFALAAPFADGESRKEETHGHAVLGRNRCEQRPRKREPGLPAAPAEELPLFHREA